MVCLVHHRLGCLQRCCRRFRSFRFAICDVGLSQVSVFVVCPFLVGRCCSIGLLLPCLAWFLQCLGAPFFMSPLLSSAANCLILCALLESRFCLRNSSLLLSKSGNQETHRLTSVRHQLCRCPSKCPPNGCLLDDARQATSQIWSDGKLQSRFSVRP